MKHHQPAADEKPLVSVILPTFNRAWAVTDAVDSVLNQDYPNIELIVIDDGSTDGTRELLTERIDGAGDRITLLEHRVNRGKGAALATGVARATGEYVIV